MVIGRKESTKRLEKLLQEFDEVPWTIQQTFLAILLTLVPWIVFAVGLNSLGGGSESAKALSPQQDLLNALLSFVFSTLVEGAFLIAPLYLAYRAVRSLPKHRRLLWQALGFRAFDGKRVAFWIAVLFVAILATNVLYSYLLTRFHLNVQTNDQRIFETSRKAPVTTYAVLLASVLLAPFCEEVFFRSLVFMGLKRDMPLLWAIILSSLIFAIAHADIGSFAVLFLIGAALAFLRWRTNSIWPGMLLHFVNNGFSAIVLILAMRG